MTDQGDRTRQRLLDATAALVAEHGYPNVTTRRIAQAAGVAEGTLYRHYPDKTTLFFAAVAHRHTAEFDRIAALPDRAGHGDLTANLLDALTTLARLRSDLLPLELAVLADPTLARSRSAHLVSPPRAGADVPAHLAQYLAAEQRLGRIDPDVDTGAAAITLLATLFGLAVLPHPTDAVDPRLLRTAVTLFVTGVQDQTKVSPPLTRADALPVDKSGER